MAKNDLASIGDIYGGMLSKFKHDNHLTNESHNQNAFNSPMTHAKVEPLADGQEVDIEDDYVHDNALADHHPDECSCKKSKKPKKAPVSKEYLDEEDEEEIFAEEIQKSNKKYLNKHMSKSKFDSIVKKVLRENFGPEEEALGIPDDATEDADMDFGDEGMDDEGGDEVTITIPRDVAQQLIDVLQAVVGGEEDLGDEDLGDEDLDLDFEDEGMDDEGFGEEDEMDYDEDEESQGQPTQKGKGFIGKDRSKPAGPKKDSDKKKTFQLPKSNKVNAPGVKVSGGQASSDHTYEWDSKESEPPITQLQGKNNKVPGKVTPGDFFK